MTTRTLIAAGVMLAVGLSACSTTSRRESVVRAPRLCEDMTLPVYFEPNDAEITRDGRRAIVAGAAQAKGCKVDEVRVLGLADAAGDPAANLELSKKRAASVAAAIRKAGLPDAAFEMSAAGQAGSVTAGGQAPVRRRADVTIKLSVMK